MLRILGLIAVTATLLAACAPRAQLDTNTAPPPRLPGMTGSAYVTLQGERVYYEVGGEGPPVVLVHGIGGGNSGFQWRLNTAALAGGHRVYVLDLPGFGRSPARPREYTDELYTGALRDFLRDVVREPAGVVASSLAGAYAVRVAATEPGLVTRLLLVSPAGIEKLAVPPNDTFYRALTHTPLGPLIAAFLRSPAGVNYFLTRQVYLEPSRVTPEITDVYVRNLASAHKAYPVYAFISGKLNADIANEWAATTQPALLVWGSDDVNTPVQGARAFQERRPGVPLEVLRARALPNDEQAAEFNRLAVDFLK